MRPKLMWALLATVVASALALWTSERAPAVIAAVERQQANVNMAQAALANTPATQSHTAKPLPAQLDPSTPEPPQRDPFAPVLPPAPPTPPPVVTAEKPFVGPPAPVAPTPPALTHRYLGRMTTPTGEAMVFLASPSRTVAVKAGDRLDDGYVVESVNDHSVQLVHPSFDVRVAIPLPGAAAQSGS